ncbi:kynureninase [Tilletiaria anomala UBC 951]|uniref:Kynureninase n=1 Tax=Tilletiaria anomala (strain ATCC 24038 / CBS 436.72 / UBC 951) TaxID=1037660 RepID=A0A066VSK4_TILAU|nr:kynureninase [Tilletiaria anomala UBC 951]KDN44717.1 kynureninase [Tilletiaria anomala UBC 951]
MTPATSSPLQTVTAEWYAKPHSSFSKDAFLSSLQQQQVSGLASTLDRKLAKLLDEQDSLAVLRQEYHLPTMQDIGVAATSASSSQQRETSPVPTSLDQSALYLCGNSLGPLPKRSKQLLYEEIDVWGSRGVLGHFDHPLGRPWAKQEEKVKTLMSDLVGAKPVEVAVMGTLTQNIHNIISTFYRPHTHHQGVQQLLNSQEQNSAAPQQAPRRHKIVYEKKAFPSDVYALDSIVRLSGFDPATSLVPLAPREQEGELTLRTEDVLREVERLGQEGETAIIMLAGIQYYTGQWFEMKKITEKAKQYDIIVGWDLAHAFANVPLALHDWGVDFAIWCTYKYGSSGPGGIAGLFVHERWHSLSYEQLSRPAGWYGHERSTRFAMPPVFKPEHGAAGWIVSNPSALDIVALQGSLETLGKAPALAGMQPSTAAGSNQQTSVGEGKIMPILRNRSLRLTAYLEHLLLSEEFLPKSLGVSIVTPADPHQRGSQLCIRIPDPASPASCNRANGSSTDTSVNGDVPPPIDGRTLVARAHKKAEKEYGLVADIRNPDMLRMAPLAQYSSFEDVWRAANAISHAIKAELQA